MNVHTMVSKLKKQYPGKRVIITDLKNPGEIICETEPTEAHPDWSEAIAVIDFTRLHFHPQLTETYEVLRGELDITVNGKLRHLRTGEKIAIPPLTQHHAVGHDTMIRVSSRPGWTPQNHILVIDGKDVSRGTYDKHKT